MKKKVIVGIYSEGLRSCDRFLDFMLNVLKRDELKPNSVPQMWVLNSDLLETSKFFEGIFKDIRDASNINDDCDSPLKTIQCVFANTRKFEEHLRRTKNPIPIDLWDILSENVFHVKNILNEYCSRFGIDPKKVSEFM